MEKKQMKTISELKNSINMNEKKKEEHSAKKEPEKAEKNAKPEQAPPEPDTGDSDAELAARLADAETQNKELLDKYQRALAEFDNFRKRTAKEKASIYSDGAADIIKALLPVFDSFDRALAGTPDEERKQPAYVGLTLIYKQLLQFMEQNGIKEIEAVGKQFDPELHQALSHTEDPERGENEITEELQKGYMLNDKIIRHSMVRVAN